MARTLTLPSEAATARLAASLKECATPPLTLFLEGDLGAGKTFFVRSFIRALGFAGTVKSPTYNILESYEIGGVRVHHFDLYRFQSAVEWYDLGFDEISKEPAYHFIEWPQKIRELGLIPDLSLLFTYERGKRQVRITSESAKGEKISALWPSDVTAEKP